MTGLESIQAVRVIHCSDAWAVVLRARAGWSIAYSGDTRPSPALAAAARGATLLIHEATFEPALRVQVQFCLLLTHWPHVLLSCRNVLRAMPSRM